MKTNTDLLLTRYFGGTATAEELKKLETWLAESPENEAEFMKMTQVYELTGQAVNTNFDDASALSDFRSYIRSENQLQPKRVAFYRRWQFAAACVAVLVVVSSVFSFYFNEKTIQLAATDTVLNEILPDDSRIVLAENSTLSYTTKFAKSKKEAELSGAVKWAVGKSGNGKLRLKAGETIIEDIGTVFEVSAYPKNSFVEVKVKEGIVRFYTLKDKGLTLKAGESGLYDKKTHKFRSLALGTMKDGISNIQLNLEGVSLEQAVEIISNAYSADIQLQKGDYSDKQITVQFTNEMLPTVLNVLAKTLELKLEKTGNTYYLTTQSTN
jgi:ferric-dicitrate binding protein FerR (iron transport regulator)